MENILTGVLTLLVTCLSWWALTTWNKLTKIESDFNAHQLQVARDYRTARDSDAQINTLSSKLDKIASLEVLLAQNYVAKAEMKEMLGEIVDKLNRIDQRLDKKVDK